MKLRDRQLGPFPLEDQIGKRSYILKLPATVRLYHVFHVNNIRPCSTSLLRRAVLVIVPKGDDDEFDVLHLCCVHQVVTSTSRQMFALHDALQ
jgi:hypothetical protein